MLKKKCSRQAFLETNHAMLEARSLVNIGQEVFNDFESGDIYNLLGVIGDKVQVALDFFTENDLFWLKEEKEAEQGKVTCGQ